MTKGLTRVMLLMKNVANPRKPCMTNPARMHLISEMPDPAAYLANDLTRWDAMNENKVFKKVEGMEHYISMSAPK